MKTFFLSKKNFPSHPTVQNLRPHHLPLLPIRLLYPTALNPQTSLPPALPSSAVSTQPISAAQKLPATQHNSVTSQPVPAAQELPSTQQLYTPPHRRSPTATRLHSTAHPDSSPAVSAHSDPAGSVTTTTPACPARADPPSSPTPLRLFLTIQSPHLDLSPAPLVAYFVPPIV
ncbi:MPN domain-containing protein CG4751-like [Papaver somniferum]|uniref:MPN domain-containing protein CG4751-like n=1 Tax=Papaver somniferum TaxID=3469 RepID=UPI000E6FAFF3|nr:MPN domain-containing protein CG4751-like [Papaver somniferum]